MCLEQLWLFIVANSVVPETGLEPALVTQPDPKSSDCVVSIVRL